MRIVADESEVPFVAELDPGIDDEAVLLRSRKADALLLTADKDFGDLVFRRRLLHTGVLLMRLAGLDPDAKAGLVAAAFERHGADLSAGFAVLSDRSLRLRKATR